MAREMKDSGVEWIGMIPVDWDMIPLQYYVELNKNTLGEDTPSDYEFEYVEIGAVTLEKGISEYQHYKFSNAPSRARRIVKPDDIIVSTVRTYLKAIAIVPDKENVVVSTGFAVLSPKNICTDYLGFALKSEYFVSMVASRSVGISYPAINSSDLVKIKIPIPTEKEQTEIAGFLDKKCAEIDAILEKIRLSIEEYKKLKQSIITQAVTKGIRGDRPMKDSGIEWIGEAPSHWDKTKVKWLLAERKDKSEFGNEEPLSMSQKYGLIPTRNMDIVPNIASSFVGAKLVQKQDLVFNKLKAHLGVFSVSNYDGLVSPDYAVYYSTGLADVKFLEYLFKTPQYITEFKKKSTGIAAGLTRLYTDGLYSIYCVLPPLDEQQQIVNYLNSKIGEIDDILLKKEQYLTEIEAYKKSLIYEYVTGKKEVQ